MSEAATVAFSPKEEQGMISDLRKTYKYLPKVQGEEQRELSVYTSDKGEFTIEMNIRVTTQSYRATRTVNYEYLDDNVGVEDLMIEEICRIFAEGFEKK
jgi:hypothetical protein